jgi:hypothetical protein
VTPWRRREPKQSDAEKQDSLSFFFSQEACFVFATKKTTRLRLHQKDHRPLSNLYPGESLDLTACVVDEDSMRVRGYAGVVSFSCTDPAASLPGPFTPGGNDHPLTVAFATPGKQTVTLADSEGSSPASLAVEVLPFLDAGLGLQGLKVRPVGRSLQGECPLCGKPLRLLGPYGGEWALTPAERDAHHLPLKFPPCAHTAGEVRAALGEDGDAFGNLLTLPPAGTLPDVLPKDGRLPQHVRQGQFFTSLPAAPPEELVAQAARVAVEGLGAAEYELSYCPSPYSEAAQSLLRAREAERRRREMEEKEERERKEKAARLLAKAEAKGMAPKRFSGGGAAKTRTWLAEGLLTRGEPSLVGGVAKCLKTGLTLDLAISLASGTPFLGTFPVPRPARVAFFSGESGEETLGAAAQRIAGSKGLGDVPEGVTFYTGLPSFDEPEDVGLVQDLLRHARAEVVVIDPCYLCFGEDSESAANVLVMGRALRRVTRACLEVGATPILVHHNTKGLKIGKAPALHNLAYAGFAEIARQWLLLNPRRPFDPAAGLHRLILSYGGSAGHSGLLGVDVVEGALDLSGGRPRGWEVTVRPYDEARRLDGQKKEEGRREEKETNGARVLRAAQELEESPGSVVPLSKIRKLTKLNGVRVKLAATALASAGEVEMLEVPTADGGTQTALRRLSGG